MNYPAACNTALKRWTYLEAFREYLRLVHNVLGLWYRTGLTQAQYDSGVPDSLIGETRGETIVLPAIIKARYPYVARLSEASWQDFVQWHHRALGIVQVDRTTNLETAAADRTHTFIWSDLA